MQKLFTAEVVSKGARSGTLSNPEGLLNVTLGNPLEEGRADKGPNPEMLFAGAYSACYHGALLNAAKGLGVELTDSTVRALVTLNEDDEGGFNLSVELHAELSGVDPEKAREVMEAAHQTCPYSKALRGDAPVTLVVD
ncbi:MAG: organic hydroperoxide resistance protein [Verrucomicrobiaceae bacterium]|nr:organic hydroperoxide resistance protein [Verrucomicrobiaceae bacterium]